MHILLPFPTQTVPNFIKDIGFHVAVIILLYQEEHALHNGILRQGNKDTWLTSNNSEPEFTPESLNLVRIP